MTLTLQSKIGITGGAGYIGSFTTQYLKGLGFENLVILDNFSTGHRDCCYARSYEVDLQDKKKVNEIFEKEQFDAIIHFAALIVVPHSMERPYDYFQHNIATSLNVLDAMQKYKVKTIVFSSTCALYGTPETLPITEEMSIQPGNVYAETKAMIETMIRWYNIIYGMNYVVLRYFNACGATEDGSNGESHNPETHIIPSIIAKVVAKEPMTIFGNDYPTPDGTCVRDYIHVNDLASAHHLALKYSLDNSVSDIFNLGTGEGHSNLEIAKAVQKVAAEHQIESSFVFAPRRAGDVPALYANNEKARKILGWNPKYTNIEEIIRQAFRWYSLHQNI